MFKRPTKLVPAETNFRIQAVITNDQNLYTPTFDSLFKFSVYLNDPTDTLLIDDLIARSLRVLETPYDHEIGVPFERIKTGREEIMLVSSYRPTISEWDESDVLLNRNVKILGHLYNLNNGLIYAQADLIDVMS